MLATDIDIDMDIDLDIDINKATDISMDKGIGISIDVDVDIDIDRRPKCVPASGECERRCVCIYPKIPYTIYHIPCGWDPYTYIYIYIYIFFNHISYSTYGGSIDVLSVDTPSAGYARTGLGHSRTTRIASGNPHRVPLGTTYTVCSI